MACKNRHCSNADKGLKKPCRAKEQGKPLLHLPWSPVESSQHTQQTFTQEWASVLQQWSSNHSTTTTTTATTKKQESKKSILRTLILRQRDPPVADPPGVLRSTSSTSHFGSSLPRCRLYSSEQTIGSSYGRWYPPSTSSVALFFLFLFAFSFSFLHLHHAYKQDNNPGIRPPILEPRRQEHREATLKPLGTTLSSNQ